MEADAVSEPTNLMARLLANGGLSVDDVGVKNRVNDMAQDLNGIGGTIKNVSYAQVAASGLNREGCFEGEQSLNTEDVFVLDEDCVVSENDDYPTIKFSERFHEQEKELNREDAAKDPNVVHVSCDDQQGVGQSMAKKIRNVNVHRGTKPRAGSSGFRIGKVGKENASNGLKIRSKVESRASTKVALSKWASSVLNQIEESVSQGNDKEVPSVRGIDEVDPGDPRVMKVVNDMEDRDTVEEVDVDVGDGMMS
ncbi:hypothetical protein V6N11_081710 [Hibiscus sabdariffa]|uniref:Uncharacterized protein n=2 Tax=Hibiscus sabdariffa TaxID=183260 RepID=A0ABR2ATC0_9ROSI